MNNLIRLCVFLCCVSSPFLLYAEDEVVSSDGDHYVSIHPPFSVNFADDSEAVYMQIGVEVLTSDRETEDAIKEHMPAVKQALIYLFSTQSYSELRTRKGKKELSKKAADTIQKTLKSLKSEDNVQAVLFTSFMMQ